MYYGRIYICDVKTPECRCGFISGFNVDASFRSVDSLASHTRQHVICANSVVPLYSAIGLRMHVTVHSEQPYVACVHVCKCRHLVSIPIDIAQSSIFVRYMFAL